MNLIKNFPEIDLFFKTNSFDDTSLDQLYVLIKEKYTDKKELKAAQTLIKLELLKFSFNHTKENTTYRPQKVNSSIIVEFKELKNLTIKSISDIIEWRSNFIIRLLENQGVSKKENEFLTSDEFNKISEPLYNRFKLTKRHKKTDEFSKKPIIKKHDYEKSIGSSGVYDRIASSGGIGKIIYIRKK